MDQKQIINITENGSARISFDETPDEIQGLCARGLTTCTAIVIIGSKGMSVIHDEGFLSIESIKKEFDFVGELKEWSIFYNPKALKEKELASRLKEMQPIMNDVQYQKKYVKKDKNDLFCAVENGALVLEREMPRIKHVNTNPALSHIKEPKDISKRKAVRHLNNMCANKLAEEDKKTHRRVPIDLQFDGKKETNAPSLILPYEKADYLVRCTVNSWGDKKSQREYSEYLSQASSANKSNGENGLFKPLKNPIAKFEGLEKLYKETKNDALLLKLYINACEATGRCADSGDYEGADFYSKKSKKYLNLALNSNNPTIKETAKKLQQENDDNEVIECDENSEESQFGYQRH